jgi:ABC-type uncharacterized transport system fused permease/ATPase subunit
VIVMLIALRPLLLVRTAAQGKSSLLRILAGVWPLRAGALVRPADVVFLTQRPFVPPYASLRQQLTLSLGSLPSPSDDVLVDALKFVGKRC